MDLGMDRAFRIRGARDCEVVMNNHNAKLWVFEESGQDVVPPFLVGEVAGSLVIDADREQLRLFAETILGWLDRTSKRDSATVHRLDRGNGKAA